MAAVAGPVAACPRAFRARKSAACARTVRTARNRAATMAAATGLASVVMARVAVPANLRLQMLAPTPAELRATPALSTLTILQRGNRLSITPVTQAEWDAIQSML